MPTYEFKCSDCGENFIEILTMEECDTIPPCPKCGKLGSKKVWRPLAHEWNGGKKYGKRRITLS